MDPFSLTFSIVVVVFVLIFIYVITKGDFIRIYFGHVIVTSPANRVQHIHLKDTGCNTICSQWMQILLQIQLILPEQEQHKLMTVIFSSLIMIMYKHNDKKI